MLKGKTQSGFEYNVDEKMTKDWRFIRLVKKMTKGSNEDQIAALDDALIMVLGSEEEADRLLQHIEKQNEGYAPADKVVEEFNEIISSINEEKN